MNARLGRRGVYGVVLVTALLWWVSAPIETISPERAWLQGIGGVIVALLVLSFVLSVRHRTLERVFGGLSSLASVRRRVEVAAGLLLAVHSVLAELTLSASISPARSLGIVTVFVFAATLFVAALSSQDAAKKRWVARTLQLVVLFSLALHMYVANSYGLATLFSPLALWMVLLLATGAAALVYAAFLHAKRGLQDEAVVVRTRTLNSTARESTVRMKSMLDVVVNINSFLTL